MKTTIEIHDDILIRGKRHAQKTGRSLRAVVEDGLRRVLDPAPVQNRYALPDLRVGDPSSPDPLEGHAWPEVRELIYEDRETR